MADPISIMAIAGLVYAGRKMGEGEVEEPPQQAPAPPLLREEPVEEIEYEEGVPEWEGKEEQPNFAEIAPQKRSSGGEILQMRNRMYDSGRMNNIAPVEKQLVGPGLNVHADVPAYGGYQQMFRVNPVNTGEYRLTTLPGRSNHGHDVRGGRRTLEAEVGFNRPEKTAFLPERLPVVRGKSQGFSGRAPRSEHETTKRPTVRSQTGMRTDGLDKNPAKRFIPGPQIPQMPTKFKSDGNHSQYYHVNNAQPGISSFHGGYTESAAAKVRSKTNDELMRLGFRPEDKRGQMHTRPGGNPGRMNVREGPVKQGGKATTVRFDSSRVDGRTGPANGGWMQDYKQADFHKFNAFKGHVNPLATNSGLSLAKRQLENNPFNNQIN
jgi:hypothetical protein